VFRMMMVARFRDASSGRTFWNGSMRVSSL